MYITLLSFHIVTLLFRLPDYGCMEIAEYMLLLCHLNNKIEVCYRNCCCYSFSLSFMRVYMWLRERDWWWCSEKKGKPSFFSSSSSFSLSFNRIWLMRYLTTTSYLSFSFSCRWDSICSLEVYSTNGDSTKRERTRQDNCVHYWNKWSCFATHQNKTTDEKRRRRRRRTRRDE